MHATERRSPAANRGSGQRGHDNMVTGMPSAMGQMSGRGRIHQTPPASASRRNARRGALKARQHQGGEPGTGHTGRPGTKTPGQDECYTKHEAAVRDNGGYGDMYTSIMAETTPWEYGDA